MITLRDIADRVGVSVSAVSMALQDHPRIGAETKERVRQAAEDLGYVANAAGRALRSRRAQAIAVVVPNTGSHVFGHPYFMHILQGVTDVAHRHDAEVLISTAAVADDSGVTYDHVLRSGAADGVVLTSAAVDDKNLKRLVEGGLPVVLLGRYPGYPHVISAGVDDYAAAYDITEHLILADGRTRLAHIAGPLNHQEAIDRRQGFVDACRAHAVTAIDVEGDFSEESGVAAIEDLADLDDIDGVFAANDEMAFGALTVLKGKGIAVPERVSLVGFDDFGISRVTSPAITTVSVPAQAVAQAATERLFTLLDADEAPTGEARLVLPVRIVVRESCGCGGSATPRDH